MSRYTIKVRPAANRDLHKIDPMNLSRISEAIDRLADNPRPAGCRIMEGREGYDRIRVGDSRIVFDIQDKILIVLAVRVR